MANQNKPSYKVPSMPEIEVIPWNGFNVVSTFSGCGGSCLGYRMAGFRVLWASEFIPAAQEAYKLNHPDSILDTRDIRIVQPEEILEAIGLKQGEVDILDGSPPCASFSTAGKREKGWGQIKQYSDTKQRVDDLFFEYARILKGLQPKVFVAENVSGLVKGKAKGYFKLILKELKDCGYNVKARVLDAQWLGVPQMRQRVIFIGVRNDLGLEPVYPKPLPYRYSVREAIPWVVKQAVANDIYEDASLHPARTVLSSNGKRTSSTLDNEHLGYVEARAYRDKRGAFGNEGDITDQPAPTVLSDSVGTHWVIEPETDISRYAIGEEWDRLEPGQQSDKYFQLVKAPIEGPCPSITCPPNGQFSQTAPSGSASVTHPTEKRKFTIAELKRICAFPDDFKLTGSYAQQWERLGRAVPPVMMAAIAGEIRDQILKKL